MPRAARQPGPDLFAAAAAEEARLTVEAAELAREAALRRVRTAPPGEIGVLRHRAKEATTAALAAEIVLAKAEVN